MRILELFAGIGGVAAAVKAEKHLHAEIVVAVDIDAVAKSVYQANFSGHYRIAEIGSVSQSELAAMEANVWWMSPPCLPFSIRGLRRDLHDLRNQALVHLIGIIAKVKPPVAIIENVPGFESSESCKLLIDQLSRAGYGWQILDICPTSFGWCNRRRRIYFVAWQKSRCVSDHITFDISLSDIRAASLDGFIDSGINRMSHPELFLSDEIVTKYLTALDRLTYEEFVDAQKPTACFAASYGKTYLHAGSFLMTKDGLRRFSPDEVKRQLGFDESFVFPESITTRTAWKLLGSSLCVPVVRSLLRAVNNAIDLD